MENNFKFYNTLTRQIDTVVPRVDGKIGMYTCGPTVYHFAHIGNIRSYIMEDVLEKALRYVGYDVKRVMNITDVGHLSSDGDTGEDKMLKGAKREHKSVMEVAKEYTDAFFKDFTAVHNRMPDVVEPATNCIPEFIHMVEVLIEKGYAYFAGGNVYFDTSKLDDYFVFSSAVEKEQLQVGVRDDVEEDVNKKNKNDFVLWFTQSKFEDQALKWDSPWGVGYPGWHIECSCISMKHLGEYVDIHCGGVDNIFPHHTNEIAQSESYLGHDWCKYWFHVNHLNDRAGKMSKSKGAILTVSVLQEKGYNIFATKGTAQFLETNGVHATVLHWPDQSEQPNTLTYIKEKKIDLVVTIPKNLSKTELSNDYTIRRSAIDFNIPLITNARLASAFITAFCKLDKQDIKIKSWNEY